MNDNLGGSTSDFYTSRKTHNTRESTDIGHRSKVLKERAVFDFTILKGRARRAGAHAYVSIGGCRERIDYALSL
jgi:hypothetical protein